MRGHVRALLWLTFAALVAFMLAAGPVEVPLVGRLDRQIYDQLLRWRVDGGWPKDLILIRIDETAMAKVGRFPWPRTVMAGYLKKLDDAGIKTVLLDSIITAPSGKDLAHDDLLFGAALGRSVIGHGYEPAGGERVPLDVMGPFAGKQRAAWRRTLRADQVLPPLAQFVPSAAGFGIPIFFADPDGLYRSFPPFIGIHGIGSFPTLATRAWMKQRDLDPLAMQGDKHRVTFPGGRSLHLDDGDMRLDLVPGGRTPPSILLTDLDTAQPDILRKKLGGKLGVVFVDSVAAIDKMPSPLREATPGGLLLAYAIRTLDGGRVPYEASAAWPLGVLGALSALGLFLTARRSPGVLLGSGGAAALLLIASACVFSRMFDWIVPVIPGLIFLAIASVAIVVDSGREADVERRRLRALLDAAKLAAPGATGSRPLADVDSGGRGPAAPIAESPISQSDPAISRPASAPLPAGLGDLATPVQIRQYRIERAIGRGGMGAIFLAHDTNLDRKVALKVLQATEKSSFARFRREALAVARISHPNVVQVYEIGLDASVPYIVMEYVAGGTLHDLLSQANVRLHWTRAAKIGASIARGLGAAHDKGIVHRDMKPSNVLLVKQTGTDVKIADFGIAKLAGSQGEALTADNVVVGSVGYLSPEQALSRGVDPRSDVFSLGVTIFRMIAGRMAFTGTVSERLLATVQKPVDDVRRWSPETPAEVAALIQRWASIDPEARPANGAQAARELDALIARAPHAPPPTPPRAPAAPATPDEVPTTNTGNRKP